MSIFPKPESFSDAWRISCALLIAGSGIIATLMCAAIIAILAYAPWTAAVEIARIDALAQIGLTMCGIMAASILGLLVEGPLHRVKGKLGALEFETEGDAK